MRQQFIWTAGFLLLLLAPVLAQTQLKTARAPITVVTRARAVGARVGNETRMEIYGDLTYVITAVNEADESLLGTLIFTPRSDQRASLAAALRVAPARLPAYAAQTQVRAAFARQAACPLIRLTLPPQELEMSGVKLHFFASVLELPESREATTQLFCHFTRQRNVNRQRRGILAAINRALTGETTDADETN